MRLSNIAVCVSDSLTPSRDHRWWKKSFSPSECCASLPWVNVLKYVFNRVIGICNVVTLKNVGYRRCGILGIRSGSLGSACKRHRFGMLVVFRGFPYAHRPSRSDGSSHKWYNTNRLYRNNRLAATDHNRLEGYTKSTSASVQPTIPSEPNNP